MQNRSSRYYRMHIRMIFSCRFQLHCRAFSTFNGETVTALLFSFLYRFRFASLPCALHMSRLNDMFVNVPKCTFCVFYGLAQITCNDYDLRRHDVHTRCISTLHRPFQFFSISLSTRRSHSISLKNVTVHIFSIVMKLCSFGTHTRTHITRQVVVQ